jgi:exosome complex component RRP45
LSFYLQNHHYQNSIYRKEGGKFGFAESIANQRITAFKMETAPIDTSNIEERAEEIIAEAEPPPEV